MAHMTYDNKVIENKIEDILLTNVDFNNFLTVDTSLTEEAGTKKVINTYVASGTVEDLEMGQGNESGIEVSFISNEYEVQVTQGLFEYYDEQEAQDPKMVETGIKGLGNTMVNDLTTKALGEYAKTTLAHTYTDKITFDDVVDSVALLNMETEENIFMLVSPATLAGVRKSLKDDLKYNTDFVQKGYVGTVAGVNVIVTTALTGTDAFLGTKSAVTAFIKKGVEVEQTREANIRKNSVYSRKNMIVALTDSTKMVKITKA